MKKSMFPNALQFGLRKGPDRPARPPKIRSQHGPQRSPLVILTLAVVSALIVGGASASRARRYPSDQRHARPKDEARGTSSGPQVYLGQPEALNAHYLGEQRIVAALTEGTAQPLSMVETDMDADGTQDLVIGYSHHEDGILAIHRGNLDAFAPQNQESFEAIGRGDFPSPFLPNAKAIRVPVHPDFVAEGSFNPYGFRDLIVAARGDRVVYVSNNDGKGNFSLPHPIYVGGAINAIAVRDYASGSPYSKLLIGVCDELGAHLLVYEGAGKLTSLPLTVPVARFVHDNSTDPRDVFFVSNGHVNIFHAASMQVETIPLPVTAVEIAIGSFIYDRNGGDQIGLLAADGSIDIVARNTFNPRVLTIAKITARRRARLNGQPKPRASRSQQLDGWKIVEHIQPAMSFKSEEQPVFFRTRISDHGSDDLMMIDHSAKQLIVIAHPDGRPGDPTFAPAEISTRPYADDVTAAIAARVNIDGRPGVLAIHRDEVAPAVMMPLPDPTFFVNRTDDPTPNAQSGANTCTNTSNADTSFSCSLREAVQKANATAGTDTVQLAAGTYTLSLPRINGNYNGNQGTLEVLDSVNIVGAGQATTIIQGGSSIGNGVDMVLAVNEDITSITNATASISNLTIKFGTNRGSVAGFDGDGGGMEFDTGSSGNANLTLTNVTFDSNQTLDGNGGGLAVFNASSGATGGNGLATINNCIFTNNSTKEKIAPATGSGGGMFVFDLARATINVGTQFTNNSATGVGGGFGVFSAGQGSRTSNIHGATITGNTAGTDGGGIYSSANLVVDQGTLIDNNQANGSGNVGFGGGVRTTTAGADTVTLTKVTISNNKASTGGGGLGAGNGSGAGPTVVQFSRFANNTLTGGSGTNINNNHSTITATNNWWGTNSPASTIVNTVATTTFDPFIMLTHTASPNKIRINQSTTLTADMSKDNHGSGVALSGNLDRIIGLPITFNNAIDGSISGAQTTIQNNATATATFNAGGVAGGGKADVVVDQATVTANIIVLQPPSIAKSFSPTTIKVGATSTITFSITNPNVTTIDSSFTDDLTSGGTVTGLVVAAIPNLVNGCGGSVTANAGATSISFSNPTLAVSAIPCTIKVDVTGSSDGVKPNSVAINSTDAGNGNTASASPSLTVINPPTISKVFGASAIPLNGTTSLTFTITNPNSNAVSTLSGISFTDTLPNAAPGTLVVATPNGLTNTCSTTPTATAGSGTISLTGASLAPGASCTISVNVQGTLAGVAPNSVTASSTNGGTGTASNATLTVVAPPTINKAFNPSPSIPLNGTSTLTFTIHNPNLTAAGDLSGVAFSDTLPSTTGTLVVASTPNVINNCNGSVTAAAGTGSISLSGGSVAHNASCTLSVDVKGNAAGDAANTTGAITSTEGGTGATSNTATLKVVAPPSISKAFGAASVPLNGTTTVTFTITNPALNTTAENGVALSDTLTNGLQVASTPGVSNTCGGTVTATANSTSISLTGGSIATPGNSCTVVVNATATQGGTVLNTTGAISSTNGGTGVTSNTATLAVCANSATVTSANDSGAGSLRQAISDVCDGGTITFNLPGAGPHTITLTTGELAVAKNVIIKNNSGERITVSGNNLSRVFNINAGKTAAIIGLTISGGNAANGGGILNDGTLTVVNSTVSGNNAASDGSGMQQTATATSLTLINTTISGNLANGFGGGVDVLGGTATIINTTITNNHGDNDNGGGGGAGGLRRQGGTVILKNTIVAGNFAGSATTTRNDIEGALDATSSNNLIGDGTNMTGIANGSNGNQVGSSGSPINPQLGVLADNGGLTFTHALLSTSTAIEAGNNANLPADTFDLDGDANTAETLPVDQRGTGFPRNADSADANVIQTADIGAFELHPSIEDIANTSTNEDTIKNVSFNLGDDTGSLIATVTATSSNTTLVPNNVANLSFTGSGGSRTLQITPAANQSGTTTITVTVTATNGRTAVDTFDVTVNAVNDAPVVTSTAGNLSYTENAPATAIDPGLTVTDIDSANLTGATAAITSGFVSAQDTLAFTNQLGITGNYNSGTGVLTLTGTTTVANYQTALRSVTYQNTSDNPTVSRTVTFIADDGSSTSSPATRGITINAVNDPPVNTVPGPQSTNQNTPLAFSSGNGNQISVADVDAGTNSIQVTLTATNGTLTLSGTSGLAFTVGDGTADATMTFAGTIPSINTALNGMNFAPTAGFNGAASLTITANDLGNTGSGGPLSDTDTVNIQVSTNITVQDAQVVEPATGSVNMIFTVTLSAPAPAGGASVDFTTQQQAPALNHATAGQDYTTTSGTVSFAAGEQFKTILVPVLSDGNNAEQNETFLLILSNPVNGTLADGTATGTILVQNQPGAILMSELRTSGPAGAGDDFVEIYNNSDSPHTVAASDGSGGYGVFKMGAGCSATPVLIGVIPNGTVIPARGHYLFVGSAYSLANYGGTGAAAGDQTLSTDIENDRNVAIFSTASLVNIGSANRFDAVGFGSNTGGICDLLREGTTLYPAQGSVTEHTYFRKMCDFAGGGCSTPGTPRDTNDNGADFLLANTLGSLFGTTQRLGAPGPENLGSPIKRDPSIQVILLDTSVSSSTPPNRVRNLTPGDPNTSLFGTMSIRRRVFNNTGQTITRLRFRAVEMTTFNVPAGTADLRAISSADTPGIIISNDTATCGGPASCLVTVKGTTLETPPALPSGGGWNSTVTVAIPGGLPNGQSVNLQFVLGVQQTGSFRYLIIVEALP